MGEGRISMGEETELKREFLRRARTTWAAETLGLSEAQSEAEFDAIHRVAGDMSGRKLAMVTVLNAIIVSSGVTGFSRGEGMVAGIGALKDLGCNIDEVSEAVLMMMEMFNAAMGAG